MRIHYAQCWEDPRTVSGALRITPDDDVLSIASGGENSFALLLANPRSVVALDKNPAQLHLVELKMKAIEQLDYETFVRFVGARPDPDRLRSYGKVRTGLSAPARAYWDRNRRAIRRGIIHSGKFEGYFALFKRYVLPLIHSRRTVQRFLSAGTLEEQEELYRQVWDNRRWRWLFGVFFGKFLLSRLGRQPSLFGQVTMDRIADTLLDRTESGLTQVPLGDNFFVEYIVTGRWADLEQSHPYLKAANFDILKERLERLHLVEADLGSYLAGLPPKAFSRFNLSNVFEYVPENEVAATLKQIIRVSRQPARLAFWTLFVPRTVPASLRNRITSRSTEPAGAVPGARTFFYDQFCLWQVN